MGKNFKTIHNKVLLKKLKSQFFEESSFSLMTNFGFLMKAQKMLKLKYPLKIFVIHIWGQYFLHYVSRFQDVQKKATKQSQISPRACANEDRIKNEKKDRSRFFSLRSTVVSRRKTGIRVKKKFVDRYTFVRYNHQSSQRF